MIAHTRTALTLCLGTACSLFVCDAQVKAATISFDPTPYLSEADRPDGFFCDDCGYVLEDFEDGTTSDTGIVMSDGQILIPNSTSGGLGLFTDSVDGDDGEIDGSGNGGRSFFYTNRTITVMLPSPAVAAGLVWTDGDRMLTNVVFEAFDALDNSLAIIDGGDLSDSTYTGETPEDRFIGVRSSRGIAKLVISNMGGGSGIEIDHVQFQVVPEPGTASLFLVGLMMGLSAWRRRTRQPS